MQIKIVRKFNNYLTVVVVLLGVYIIVSPFIPAIQNWWQREHSPQSNLVSAVTQNKDPLITNNDSLPDTNRLIIPSMNLDTEILEGGSVKTVNNGVWRKPESSLPGEGSNTVLVGHRFSYNPGISHPFYSLDIVKAGDKIGLFWENKLITYRVEKVLVVDPSAIEIEQPTPDEVLTIYTCTPLWTSEKRLVVIAKPNDNEGAEV